MTSLDGLAHAGPWRRRHPGDKAVLALGLLGCAVGLPPWPGAAVVGSVALVLLAGPAGVGLRRSLLLLGGPAVFIAVGSLPLLVSVGGPGLVRWNPAGLSQAAELVGRSIAATLSLVLFATTTPLSDVLPRLHRLGLPPAIGEITVLIHRMLFLLLDTASTVRSAQAGRLGFTTARSSMRSAAGQAGTIFVRAFDRARRLEAGLALRGYTGDLVVDVDGPPPSRHFLVLSILLLIVVVGTSLALRTVLA